jgi:predicted aspartyl protease
MTITNLLTGATANLQSVIDTGFSGSIIVESKTYQELGLELVEKPSNEFPIFKTLVGSIVFRSSSANAEVAGRGIDAEILTPLYGPGKNLVGRRVLREFSTLVHREEMTCMGEARVEG